MNVTVVVSPGLRLLAEGKREIELGVPLTFNLGDLLQALFSLYPQLQVAFPDERSAGQRQLQLLADERTLDRWANLKGVLRGGERLFLTGLPPKAEHSATSQG